MSTEPFYDPLKTYEENYNNGPFGPLGDQDVFPEEEPRFTFCGEQIAFPFGMPAGPLVNARYVAAAFRKGFDVNVYKTARSAAYPCHAFPNVLAVHPVDHEGKLQPDNGGKPLVADMHYSEPLSVTNSFGVPSRNPEIWKKDALTAVESERKGQLMIMSVMGTVREGQSADDFVKDYATAAREALQTNARVYEINLSCPNIGNEGLVCYNIEMATRVTGAVKDVLGTKPLVVKIGYFADKESLETLVRRIADRCDGFAAINTIQAEIVDAAGHHPLPGKFRERSGVCGASITWAGLEMVASLDALRRSNRYRYAIVGVGGVMNPLDFKKYRDVGADVVQSATGAMWNSYLARDIKRVYPDG